MKDYAVIYYSHNGSNRFLAKRIAETLNCDTEEIKPRLNVHLFLLFGLSIGKRKLKTNLTETKKVILCDPIWMGRFISPLKDFVRKNKERINGLVFVTCCGSSYEMKDKKFGHGLVFKKIKALLKEKCIHCEALPITLVVTDDKKEDPNIVMNTRLSQQNFKGEIADRFKDFIHKKLAVI